MFKPVYKNKKHPKEDNRPSDADFYKILNS